LLHGKTAKEPAEFSSIFFESPPSLLWPVGLLPLFPRVATKSGLRQRLRWCDGWDYIILTASSPPASCSSTSKRTRPLSHCENSRIVVLKLGGSALTNEESYGHAARFLVRRLHRCSRERLLVVVSAQYGHTEELEILARSVTCLPNRRTLDLLWSIGEIRSVALLALHLEALGIAVVGLNAHETGLHFVESVSGDHQLTTLAIRAAASLCRVLHCSSAWVLCHAGWNVSFPGPRWIGSECRGSGRRIGRRRL
jgi:hypothetical protein